MKPIVITQRITKRETASFKKYLQEVDAIDTLTAEEEYEIAVKAAEGDEDAIEELVLRNLRFVISVAKQYAGPNAKLEELVNEGNYGLVKAARRFDPTKGFKFISYAVWWIRRSILEHMTKYSRTIRVPSNKVTSNKKIGDEFDKIEQQLQREPTLAEMAEILGDQYKEDEIKFFLDKENGTTTSLDKPFSEDGGTLIDVLDDPSFQKADHLVNESDMRNNVAKLLDLLPKKQQKEVLIKLYGLDGSTPMSLKEAGDSMGVTRERVRQVRDKALRYLKAKIRTKNLNYMKA